MTARRALLLALAALLLLAAASCKPGTSGAGTAATPAPPASAPQPRTAPASFTVCMVTVTKDGKTAYYKATPGHTLTVPNGTAKPFKAACHDGGWMTTEPGSGDLPW